MCWESFSYWTSTVNREKERTEVGDICLSIKPVTYSSEKLFMPTHSGRKG